MTISDTRDPELAASRRRVAATLSRSTIPIVGLALLTVVSILAYSFYQVAALVAHKNALTAADQWTAVLLIHLVKIGAGISVGLVCFFLGSAACWIKLAGAFDIESKQESLPVHISGTNAGLFILVAGLGITVFSLARPFELSSADLTVRSADQVDSPRSQDVPGLEAQLDALRDKARDKDTVDAIDRVLAFARKQRER